MKVLKPRIKCKKRGKKQYCYYVIETSVEDYDHYIVLSLHEWKKILQLYDAFQYVLALAKKYAGKVWVQKLLDVGRRKKVIEFEEYRLEKCRDGEIEAEKCDAISTTLVIEQAWLKQDIEELKKIEEELKLLDEWLENDWKLRILFDEEITKTLKIKQLSE